MANAQFSVKFIGTHRDVVHIAFHEGAQTPHLVSKLSEFFQKKLREGKVQWVFDVAGLPFPRTSFIAFVISATVQARERGGDLKIVNASDSVRNNFVTFSPLTYLTLEESLEQAILEFGQNTAASQPKAAPHLPRVDIAEPPLVERLAGLDERKDRKTPRRAEQGLKTTAPRKGASVARRKKAAVRAAKAPAVAVTHPVDIPKSPQPAVSKKFYLKTESIASNLYKICDFVVDHSRKAGMEEKQIIKTKIAVYEACLNVIEHAYHSRPDNWIEVWVEYSRDKFMVKIQDHGLSFKKKADTQYDVELAMEKRQTGGFGLHIIERSMDEVDYRADSANGNLLTLVKYLK